MPGHFRINVLGLIYTRRHSHLHKLLYTPLTYVAALHPYLKSIKVSDHISTCSHRKENNGEVRLRSRNRRLVRLGEAEVDSRLNDMNDDLFPSRKKKSKRKKNTNHKKINLLKWA